MGAFSKTQNRLSAPLKESGCFRASRKRFLSKNWLKTKTCERTRTLKGFQARLFKLGALLSQEYDLLVLEDLNVQDLIQKSENKKRKLRLYDFSFSELCLSGSLEKEKNLFYLFQRTTLHASVFCAGKSTRILKESLTPPLWFCY